MKALVLERRSESGEAAVQLRQVPEPVLAAGEALIKVRLAGLCRTDLELARGYLDFEGIPGHEFVGEVVEVEASVAEQGKPFINRRVVGEINCGCGICQWCRSGIQNHCPDRTVLGIAGRNGALAEYLTLPLENLHPVPDDVDDQTAVFTEPLAAALEILEQVRIKPEDKVLVIGDGKLGLLIARVLRIHGCDLTCVGGHEAKLEILKGWGIQTVHHRNYQPVTCDVAVEASGSPQGFSIALSSLRPRGTLILKSTYAGSLTLDIAPLVVNEINLLGSRCGPFAPALRLLARKLIPTQQLTTEIYPADQAQQAFQHARQPEALKILLKFA